VSALVDRLRSWRRAAAPAAPSSDASPVLPEAILRALRLESSRVADAAMSGFHASARLGRGVEFAGFRAYAPGDDLRLLDRRRSFSDSGLLVRQYEVERDRALLVVVDGSASMGSLHGGDDGKRRWANVIASALVRIASAQGDVACGALLAERPIVGGFVRGKGAFDRATEVFAHDERAHAHVAEAPTPDRALEAAARRVAIGAGWLVLASDFLDDAPPLLAMLGESRSRGARVVALRLETARERDFPYEAAARLRDPESGALVETFGPAARPRYAAARAAHRAAVEASLVAHGAVLVDAWTDERPEAALLRLVEAIAAQGR
jgi:uncharacterized protein (DUF58 family)